MKKEEIIADIRSYFGFTVFSGYSNYYVGITNDINRKHPTPILAVWTISATFAPC